MSKSTEVAPHATVRLAEGSFPQEWKVYERPGQHRGLRGMLSEILDASGGLLAVPLSVSVCAFVVAAVVGTLLPNSSVGFGAVAVGGVGLGVAISVSVVRARRERHRTGSIFRTGVLGVVERTQAELLSRLKDTEEGLRAEMGQMSAEMRRATVIAQQAAEALGQRISKLENSLEFIVGKTSNMDKDDHGREKPPIVDSLKTCFSRLEDLTSSQEQLAHSIAGLSKEFQEEVSKLEARLAGLATERTVCDEQDHDGGPRAKDRDHYDPQSASLRVGDGRAT